MAMALAITLGIREQNTVSLGLKGLVLTPC